MSYYVEVPPAVSDYLSAPGRLPATVGKAVFDGIVAELGDDADYFLRTRAVAHESYSFGYDYPHPDAATGLLYLFRFRCDGSAMSQGVGRVVFIDHTTEPLP